MGGVTLRRVPGRRECRGQQFPQLIILPEIFDGSKEAEEARE